MGRKGIIKQNAIGLKRGNFRPYRIQWGPEEGHLILGRMCGVAVIREVSSKETPKVRSASFQEHVFFTRWRKEQHFGNGKMNRAEPDGGKAEGI